MFRGRAASPCATVTLLALLLAAGAGNAFAQRNEPLIAGHTSIDISGLPDECITLAKERYRLSYGHTSHGSQIVSGMEVLQSLSPLYSFNNDGSGGALSLHDRVPSGDLGNPDRVTWSALTRDLLDQPTNDRNFIMWSWCGQAGTASEADIDTYLDLMSQLELDYPDVTFVYMTGHLDGTGETGNLTQRNNQVRDYCTTNNKVLFDFADIESYDPDGNYYLDLNADDGCNYDGGNWAIEWCDANPGECSAVSCAHSQSLNCDMKGRAFWWMMSRLVGGSGEACAAPVGTLRLVKRLDDVVLEWTSSGDVLGYNVWYVNTKSEIDLARLASSPPAVGVAGCSSPDTAPGANCTDLGGVLRDTPGIAYYQVRSHCCSVGEGP